MYGTNRYRAGTARINACGITYDAETYRQFFFVSFCIPSVLDFPEFTDSHMRYDFFVIKGIKAHSIR